MNPESTNDGSESQQESAETKRSHFPSLFLGGLALVVCLAGFALLILPGIQPARRGPIYSCINSMRNVGTAVMNYSTVSAGMLPVEYIRNDEGQILHSWRVSVLPLLDNAKLHRQIDHEQPWDAPVNEEFRQVEIRYFRCQDDPYLPPNGTSYFTIVGEETPFPPEGSVKLDDIKKADGLATTLMLAEACQTNIEWMQPKDLIYNDITDIPKNLPGKAPSSYHKNSNFNVFFTDGHASSLSGDIDPAVIRALCTWNGGEELPEDF